MKKYIFEKVITEGTASDIVLCENGINITYIPAGNKKAFDAALLCPGDAPGNGGGKTLDPEDILSYDLEDTAWIFRFGDAEEAVSLLLGFFYANGSLADPELSITCTYPEMDPDPWHRDSCLVPRKESFMSCVNCSSIYDIVIEAFIEPFGSTETALIWNTHDHFPKSLYVMIYHALPYTVQEKVILRTLFAHCTYWHAPEYCYPNAPDGTGR